MPTVLKQLGQAAIGTTLATIYTVPASTTMMIKELAICNTTAAAITVNVFAVPSGGTAGTGNALIYGYSVGANLPAFFGGLNTVLAAGATIQVSASAAGLTITASGVEVS